MSALPMVLCIGCGILAGILGALLRIGDILKRMGNLS